MKLREAITQTVRFSILIPTYNSAGYLRDTLESLRHQTLQDFEVVIVDDRSTDETPAAAAALLTEMGIRGSVTIRPANLPGGASGCRNIALGIAHGEWIAFLDSDDVFAPDKLARVDEAIRSCDAVVAAVYHKSYQFDDSTGAVLGEVSAGGLAHQPEWLVDRLLSGNFHATCGMVLKRELLFQLGGFDTALNGVEDWWLAIRVSTRTPWLFLDETLAGIRLRGASLMRNQPFVHYVRQHVALLAVARRSKELTSDQLEAFRSYVMGSHSLFLAGRARSRSGWIALLPGVGLMVRSGYALEAARLGFRQTRSAVLASAASVRHRLSPKRAPSA